MSTAVEADRPDALIRYRMWLAGRAITNLGRALADALAPAFQAIGRAFQRMWDTLRNAVRRGLDAIRDLRKRRERAGYSARQWRARKRRIRREQDMRRAVARRLADPGWVITHDRSNYR